MEDMEDTDMGTERDVDMYRDTGWDMAMIMEMGMEMGMDTGMETIIIIALMERCSKIMDIITS